MTLLGPYSALDHGFAVDIVDGDDPRLAELLAPLAAASARVDRTYRLSLPVDEDNPGWLDAGGDQMKVSNLVNARDRLVTSIGLGALKVAEGPVLHACVIAVDGKGVLVTGPSGAGKSTLTARLAAGGGALVAEDITVLAADGTVRPYHRPLALSADSLEALDLPVPDEDCRCGCMKHLVPPDELGGAFGGPTSIDLVVFTSRDEESGTDLTLAEALARLFVDGGIGNVDESAPLEAVASALAGAPCVVLGTADLDAAARTVTELLRQERSAVEVASEQADDAAIVYLDGEALVHVGNVVHHLDPVATAVWVLHTEGLTEAQIAQELGWEDAAVVDTLERLRALELPEPAMSQGPPGGAVKRALDIIGAGLALVVLGPVLLVAAVVCRVAQGRPVLHRDLRAGWQERPFALLKLRTMTDGRDDRGALLPDSARLTRLGRVLRATSVDELPQLWQIVRGQMSLVGPRPLPVAYLPRYRGDEARRHEVRPGLTGWAQVHGRNAVDWDERLALDVWYVDHRSTVLDLRILGRTILQVLRREGISQDGTATMTELRPEHGAP